MRSLVAALGLAIVSVFPAAALEGPWIRKDAVAFRLISHANGVNGSTELMLGLQVRPERGWRFFWRSPGPFGLVPAPDFSASENIDASELLWPAPKRIVVLKETGDSIIGYDRETVLPIRVRPSVPAGPVTLRLKLDYGICGDACIPGNVALTLALPATGPTAGASAKLLDEHVARVPVPLSADAVRVGTEGDALVVEISGVGTLRRPDLFVEAGPGRHFGAPRVTLGGSAVFRLAPPAVMPDAGPDDGRRILTLVDGGRAFEASVTVPPTR